MEIGEHMDHGKEHKSNKQKRTTLLYKYKNKIVKHILSLWSTESNKEEEREREHTFMITKRSLSVFLQVGVAVLGISLQCGLIWVFRSQISSAI